MGEAILFILSLLALVIIIGVISVIIYYFLEIKDVLEEIRDYLKQLVDKK